MDNKFETADNAERSNNETGWEDVAAMANNFQPETPTSETTMQPETVSQPEKILTADNNVYREIAKNALKNWNGLTEEEADERILSSSVEELESQVYAQGSIKAALDGINGALKKDKIKKLKHQWYKLIPHGDREKQAKLSSEIDTIENDEQFDDIDKKELFDSILNDEKNSDIFKKLGEKLKGVEDKEEFALDVLSVVHDDWIKDNLKKLNDPNRVDKRYQFMPLEFIGIDEAKSDLIFVSPIFEAAGVKIDEAKLGYKYAQYRQGVRRIEDVREDLRDSIPSERFKFANQPKSLTWMDAPREVKEVQYYFENLGNRYDFKIDFTNVKDTRRLESCEHDWQKQRLYSAEVADQVCNKLA